MSSRRLRTRLMLGAGVALFATGGVGLATTLTGSGFFIGTPAYMSPEQSTGTHAIDARTDVYALGCVVYEMLVGEPPHAGNTMEAILTSRELEVLSLMATGATNERIAQRLNQDGNCGPTEIVSTLR